MFSDDPDISSCSLRLFWPLFLGRQAVPIDCSQYNRSSPPHRIWCPLTEIDGYHGSQRMSLPGNRTIYSSIPILKTMLDKRPLAKLILCSQSLLDLGN